MDDNTPIAVNLLTDQEPLTCDQDQTDALGQLEINSQDRGIQAAVLSLASAGDITTQAEIANHLSLRKGGGVSFSVNSGSSSHLGAP